MKSWHVWFTVVTLVVLKRFKFSKFPSLSLTLKGVIYMQGHLELRAQSLLSLILYYLLLKSLKYIFGWSTVRTRKLWNRKTTLRLMLWLQIVMGHSHCSVKTDQCSFGKKYNLEEINLRNNVKNIPGRDKSA